MIDNINYIIAIGCIGFTLCSGCCAVIYYIRKKRRLKQRDIILHGLSSNLSITREPTAPPPSPESTSPFHENIPVIEEIEHIQPSLKLREQYINELVYLYPLRTGLELTHNEIQTKYNHFNTTEDIKQLKDDMRMFKQSLSQLEV